MLTVKIKPPRSADVLRKNPLGLYVDAIDWSRELDTDVPRSLARLPGPEDLVAPPSAEAPFHHPAHGPKTAPEQSQTPATNELCYASDRLSGAEETTRTK